MDAIVVLGSGLTEAGALFPRGAERVKRGVDLYREHRALWIIVSGGYSSQAQEIPIRTEAEAMQEYLLSCGIPAEDILLEIRSRDTIENIFFTKTEYLEPHGWNTLIVVTSDYHVARVEMICAKVLGTAYRYSITGVDTYLEPHDLEQRQQREKKKMEIFQERFKDVSPGDDAAIQDS